MWRGGTRDDPRGGLAHRDQGSLSLSIRAIQAPTPAALYPLVRPNPRWCGAVKGRPQSRALAKAVGLVLYEYVHPNAPVAEWAEAIVTFFGKSFHRSICAVETLFTRGMTVGGREVGFFHRSHHQQPRAVGVYV